MNNLLKDFIEKTASENDNDLTIEDAITKFVKSIFNLYEDDDNEPDEKEETPNEKPATTENNEKEPEQKAEPKVPNIKENKKFKSMFPQLTIKNGSVNTNINSNGINHDIKIYCTFQKEHHFPCVSENVRKMLEYPVSVWENYIYDRIMDESDTAVTKESNIHMTFVINSDEWKEEMVVEGYYEHEIEGFVFLFDKTKLYYLNQENEFEFMCELPTEEPAEENKPEETNGKIEAKPCCEGEGGYETKPEYEEKPEYVCFKDCCYCKDCEFYRACCLGEVEEEIDWNGLFEDDDE